MSALVCQQLRAFAARQVWQHHLMQQGWLVQAAAVRRRHAQEEGSPADNASDVGANDDSSSISDSDGGARPFCTAGMQQERSP